ncbi:MAG: hypothetical protein JO079_12800 [Frankiaceae bacterium]|nr:hypothetical protein [Frankiaceae bacterium]MBV9368401.1 hypothetical protein [Frankiales bacterium]
MAEPPAPILPAGFDDEDGGNDNRRKLMFVAAGLGVLVLVVVAFFLLKSGGSSPSSNQGFAAPPHHPAKTAPAAANPGAVTLPKVVTNVGGKDPFKPLYVQPAPKLTPPAQSATAPTTPTVPAGSTGSTGGGTTTAPAPAAYAPVWISLVSVNGTTSATFTVGYSNGKSLRTSTYRNVLAPTKSLRTDFGNVFSLLSIQDGQATVQFGDGSPFDLVPGASHRHPLG